MLLFLAYRSLCFTRLSRIFPSSKVKFFDPQNTADYLPFTSYPLSDSLGQLIKTDSVAATPNTASDLPDVDAASLIAAVGGYPPFPGEELFWEEMTEVVDIQLARRAGADSPFPLPAVWDGKSIDDVAEAVNDEYPGFWQQRLLETFWGEGLSLDYNIIPFHSNNDFIGRVVRLAELNTWSVSLVSNPNFLLKWTVGKLRPEEAAFQIAKNLMTGVPEDLQEKVDSMGLVEPEHFTAYEVGSPTHPSWPAMHSAASAASLWLAIVANLSPEQYCQALLTDYAVAFARTVAGVHYRSDNIAGLNLGQELVANALPDYLATKYGADKAAVEAKIAGLRFDWATFDPETCTHA